MPTEPPQSANSTRRSKTYFYQPVVIEVEGTLYRVPKHGFEKWSESAFPDMFRVSVPHDSIPGQTWEGDTIEDSIRLVGCTRGEFESLLELLYPTKTIGLPNTLCQDEWVGILKLARLWDMPQVATLAIEKLEAFNMGPIDKVRLGRAYNVPSWLKAGCASLAGDTLAGKVTLQEMASLGWETAFRILWARENLLPQTPRDDSLKLMCGFCVSKSRYVSMQKDAEGMYWCSNCSGYPGKGGKKNGWGVYIPRDAPGLEVVLGGVRLVSHSSPYEAAEKAVLEACQEMIHAEGAPARVGGCREDK